jgi:cytochrome c biogenesis protein CcdA
MILLVFFAFLAGVVTILSPCILPILPIILSSTIGGVYVGKSRPLGVVTGFILSFTFFTLFLSAIVSTTGISASSLRLISVFVIGGFGLTLLVPKFQTLVEMLFAKLSGFVPSGQTGSGFGTGLVIGISIGLLWTPCVGPILASVITLAITGAVSLNAFYIILAYSLGTAIPMFAILIGGQNLLTKVPWLVKNTGKIQKAFGVIMILTAMGIYTNVDRRFQTYILEKFPEYGIGLTKLEDNETVRKNLDKLNGDVEEEKMGKPSFEYKN